VHTLLKRVYFFSLFLILLPSFYLADPPINVLNLAKLLWIIVLISLLLGSVLKKTSLKIRSRLLILFLLFFLSQTLSVINAQNITSFLEKFKELSSILIMLILSIYFIKSKSDVKKIIIILFIDGVINLGIQLLIVVSPNLFIGLGNLILHPNYLKAVVVNIERGRIFLASYNEMLIPLVFYILVAQAKEINKKILGISTITIITVFSALSGFRTNLLMSSFAILGTIFLYRKFTKLSLFIICIVLFTLLGLYSITPFLNSKTGIERVFDTEGNVNEISSGRVNKWEKAIQMGLSSPLTGVGLGNYFDYLPSKMQRGRTGVSSIDTQFEIAAQDPHNIFLTLFSETGVLGLISFILLLLYFIHKDLTVLIRGDQLAQSISLSFWTLLIFSLFNPSYAASFQVSFWILRTLLEVI